MTLTTTPGEDTTPDARAVVADRPPADATLETEAPPRRRRVRLIATAALVAVLALLNATLLFQARAVDDQATSADERRRESLTAAEDARTDAVAAQTELDVLAAELPLLQAEIDAQLVALSDATTRRDSLREQLVALKAQLASVEQSLDASFIQILGNNDVIEHLRGCFHGVNRSLNLAALDRDDDAAVAILEVALQCANAQSALAAGAGSGAAG